MAGPQSRKSLGNRQLRKFGKKALSELQDLKSKTPRLSRGALFYKRHCITKLNSVKENFHFSQRFFYSFLFKDFGDGKNAGPITEKRGIFFTFCKNFFILFFSMASKIRKMKTGEKKVQAPRKRPACTCPCHRSGGRLLHIVPCCGPGSLRWKLAKKSASLERDPFKAPNIVPR